MARFRKIDLRLWGDEKFRRLSRPGPNAQTLFIYLITGPHTTALPGLSGVGEAALAEALDWPVHALRKAMVELIELGMVKFDRAARVVWVPNVIKYNSPQSPNVVRGWRPAWDEIPECDLRREARQVLGQAVCAMGDGYAKAFGEALTEVSPDPFRQVSPNQEQEQEQEQEEYPPKPPKGGEGASVNDEGFARFWESYPKRKAKAAAQRAWSKLAPSPELLRTILAAVERQKASADWQREEGRFIPHPASWLNQRRWEDEAGQPVAAAAASPEAEEARLARVLEQRRQRAEQYGTAGHAAAEHAGGNGEVRE
jgi:hypothetical protein